MYPIGFICEKKYHNSTIVNYVIDQFSCTYIIAENTLTRLVRSNLKKKKSSSLWRIRNTTVNLTFLIRYIVISNLAAIIIIVIWVGGANMTGDACEVLRCDT